MSPYQRQYIIGTILSLLIHLILYTFLFNQLSLNSVDRYMHGVRRDYRIVYDSLKLCIRYVLSDTCTTILPTAALMNDKCVIKPNG